MTDSQRLSAEDEDIDDDFGDEPPKYGLNLLLFALTALSVFWTGAAMMPGSTLSESFDPRRLVEVWRGWPFALPLLAILVSHEAGHYVAARLHRVPASLPFFIPLPKFSPFGTMGAVIGMSGRIRSRVALLDIGAAGPLAGLAVALPILAFGLSWSQVGVSPEHYNQEGQSLLYWSMKRLFVGPIPDGMDVQLHPTAEAGWVGLLITMINLLPWGQLDGGHIAYALLGERQNTVARWVRGSLLLLFAYNAIKFFVPVLRHTSGLPAAYAFGNSLFWLTWFAVTWIVGFFSGGGDHPSFEPGLLGRKRRAIAWLCVVLFFLLFMPTPYAAY